MSIVEPTIDPRSIARTRRRKYSTRDEVGRRQEECMNCGQRIIWSSRYRDWLHPERGYSSICHRPMMSRPLP